MRVPTSVRRIYAGVMAAVVGLLFVGALLLSTAYTRHVQRDADRRQTELRHEGDARWCALLDSLDQPQAPATTERGRLVQRQIHQLRIELGCA